MDDSHRDKRDGFRVRLWALLAIVVIAAALRFHRLGAKSYWLDEATSVYLCDLSMVPAAERSKMGVGARLGRMIHEIKKHDAHPPLYQIMLFVSLEVFGRSEAAARLPSALAGVFTVLLMYRLGSRLFGSRAGLMAAGLAGVSAHLIYFSQEARLHSVLICLTAAHACLLVDLLRPPKRGAHLWCLYVLLGAAGLWTYAPYGCVLVGHWAFYALYGSRSKKHLSYFALAQVVVVISILPWVPVMRQVSGGVQAQLAERPGDARPLSALGVSASLLEATAGLSYARWVANALTRSVAHMTALAWMTAAAWAVACWGLVRGCMVRGVRGARAYALCLVPVAAYLALPIPRVHDFELKHAAFCIPFFVLGIASLLSSGRVPVWLRGAAAGVLVVANVLGYVHYASPRFEKEPWRAAIQRIESLSRPGDLIMFNPAYAQAPYHVYGVKRLPVVGPPSPFGEKMTRWLPKKYRRVWLLDVDSRVARADPIPARWLGRKWREPVPERTHTGYLGRVRVRMFERPRRGPLTGTLLGG